MTIPEPLLSAYESAHYRYRFCNQWWPLRAGVTLDSLLLPPATTSCAFITAMNPRSVLLCEQDNRLRNLQLIHWLNQRHQRYLAADAIDPQGDWPREYGLLWLNPTPHLLCKALVIFDQHAVLASFGERFSITTYSQLTTT